MNVVYFRAISTLTFQIRNKALDFLEAANQLNQQHLDSGTSKFYKTQSNTTPRREFYRYTQSQSQSRYYVNYSAPARVIFPHHRNKYNKYRNYKTEKGQSFKPRSDVQASICESHHGQGTACEGIHKHKRQTWLTCLIRHIDGSSRRPPS